MYQTMPTAMPSQSQTDTDGTDSTSTLTQDFDKYLDFSTSEDVTTTSEYLTPTSTLKNGDYDEFKKQMHEEFINNSNLLKSVNEDTLKSNQPIDPSRINDSLKLYSEHNMMSKSFCGTEQSLRMCPSTMQYQTIASIDPQKIHDTFNLSKNDGHHSKNYALQKSGSASSRIISSENENWMEKGLNRSKSGPNWYDNNNYSDNDNCETLKPSTIRKNHEKYTIQMDCYGETSGITMRDKENDARNCSNDNTPVGHDVDPHNMDGVVLRKQKTGSTAIKRRSGNKR